MNVLVLTTHLNPGGISSYIYNLAKGLIQKGHKVIVVSSGGIMSKSFSEIGAEIIDLDIKTKAELSPKLWFNLGRVAGIAREKNINVIHAHTRVCQVLAQVISSRLNKSYVSTCHGYFKPRWFRRRFGCWGDKVIAISGAVKDHLEKDLNVDSEKIALVYNGIDLGHFRIICETEKPTAKRKMGLENKFTIGIIARLSDIKGHEYLIQASKKILDQYIDTQLLIVGDGPLKDNLLGLVKRLKIEDKVHFHPAVLDTRQALKAIDIFCMPSLKEGLGLAVIEAQATGIPVVASKVGGLVNLVKDNQTGLLVEPADSDALTATLIRLLNDKNLVQRLAHNARKFVEDNLSLSRMVSKIESIYEEVQGNEN